MSAHCNPFHPFNQFNPSSDNAELPIRILTLMIRSTIPSFDKEISQLVLGTMVCTTDDQELSNSLLDRWLELGGNCLDSAHVYGGGKSERAIGVWMKNRGNRDQVVVLDKGAHPYWTEPRVNPECIARDIAESLERLQTEYIDLYLLHRDDPAVPVGPIVDALDGHQRPGRIRAFGGSNWSTARIDEANRYAAENGLRPFNASSPHLSLAHVNEVMWGGCLALNEEGRRWHTRTQMPLFPWSSQAGGLFAGRYSPNDRSNADAVRVYYNDGNWERLRRARELASAKGCSANNVALAWVLHQPFPVFPLIGPRSIVEMEESVRALEITLSPGEMAWLNLETETSAVG